MPPTKTDGGPKKKQVTIYATVDLYEAAKKADANISELLDIALAGYLHMESPDLIRLEEKHLRSQNAYNAVSNAIEEKEQKARDAVTAKEEHKRAILVKVYAEWKTLKESERNRIIQNIKDKKWSESAYDFFISHVENRTGLEYNDVSNALREIIDNGGKLEEEE